MMVLLFEHLLSFTLHVQFMAKFSPFLLKLSLLKDAQVPESSTEPSKSPFLFSTPSSL